MPFAELRLAEPIVRAIATKGYAAPTPIQSKAIPETLAGRDVLGCAQTGTGKTGAFALPMLHTLAQGDRPAPAPLDKRDARRNRGRSGGSRRPMRACRPRALVLSPTRELATQIHESFQTYGCNLRLKHVVIFGGVSQAGQVRAMRGGADVIVATPGRLLDLMQQGIIDISAVEVLVLDEADHMLDMGFIHDIRKIIDQVPDKRQTLFFSATMPDEIRALANAILTDPVYVETDKVASTVDTIEQRVYMVSRGHKPTLLKRLIGRDAMTRTLVFTRTKRGADKLVTRLERGGIQAAAIHGNKNQNARTRALEGFKAGHIPVLVATDIAARGIDVSKVTHVVNFDIPSISETYVHRVGRTARAGAAGIALSLCAEDERRDLRAIERLIDQTIPVAECDDDLLKGDGEGAVETARKSRGAVADKRATGRRTRRQHSDDRPQRRPERRTDDHSEGRKPYAGKYRPRPNDTVRSSGNGFKRTGASHSASSKQNRPAWTAPTSVKPAGKPYARKTFDGKPYVGKQGTSANGDKKDGKPRRDDDRNEPRDSRPAWKQSSAKPSGGKKFAGKKCSGKKFGGKKFEGKTFDGKRTSGAKPRSDSSRPKPMGKSSSDKPTRRSQRTGYSPRNTRRAGGGLKRRTSTQRS